MAEQVTASDKIEKATKSNMVALINENENFEFRDLTGKDYGIDGVIEVYDNGTVTGKYILVQFKGKKEKIKPLVKTPNKISVPGVSLSNGYYALQNKMPIIILHSSMEEKNLMYYENLHNIINTEWIDNVSSNCSKKGTVYISADNISIEGNQENFKNFVKNLFDEN